MGGGIFAYILFMDLLGRWGMQLRRLQTLPYLTNQPFDVRRSEAGCGGACQMKIAGGWGGGVAHAHDCGISKQKWRSAPPLG